jgi:hypothetical protein
MLYQGFDMPDEKPKHEIGLTSLETHPREFCLVL